MGQQLALVVGSALDTLCFARFGPEAAFTLDALSFGLSFALISVALNHTAVLRVPAARTTKRRNLAQEILEGWHYLFDNKLLRKSFMVTFLHVAGAGINSTVMLLFLTQTRGHSSTYISRLSAINGIAQALAGGLILAFTKRAALPVTLFVGALVMAVGVVFTAGSPSLPILVLSFLVTSLGNAPTNIDITTFEQRYIPLASLGRVRGIVEMGSPLLFLLMASVSGALVYTVGPRQFLVMSACFSVSAFMLTTWLVRDLKVAPHPPDPQNHPQLS